jgi:hypothetical protein
MISSTKYQSNRATLNYLMDFITTDEFMELPAPERQQYLECLKQLLGEIIIGGKEDPPTNTI